MAYFVYTRLLFIFVLSVFNLVDCRRKMNICGTEHLLMQNGSIESPFYPRPYPQRIDCTWTILPPPNAPLIIMVKDIDIKEDQNCTKPPCCASNHLSLPSNDSGENVNFCGDFTPNGPINLIKNQTIIKYRSSEKSRGFYLSYIIGRTICERSDFRCGDGTCLPKSVRCDYEIHCGDESDEIGCPVPACPDGICQNLCNFNQRLCFNGKCIDENFWCNGINDCGDNSDEDDCSKIAIITLFIMGGLMGALFLIIGIMCSLRYHDRRNYVRNSQGYGGMPTRHIAARMSNGVSLDMDQEFLYRDPPPSYAAATGQFEPELNSGELDPLDPRYRSRSTKPPTPSPSSESSNESSPSRNNSITSSSYLSTEGSVHLLSLNQ